MDKLKVKIKYLLDYNAVYETIDSLIITIIQRNHPF